jgi:hypothetical protein
MRVLETMIAHSQFCFSGDNTLPVIGVFNSWAYIRLTCNHLFLPTLLHQAIGAAIDRVTQISLQSLEVGGEGGDAESEDKLVIVVSDANFKRLSNHTLSLMISVKLL